MIQGVDVGLMYKCAALGRQRLVMNLVMFFEKDRRAIKARFRAIPNLTASA